MNKDLITINPLDPSQEYIVDSFIEERNTDDVSIVFGPPGTGKSHLIVSLLFELALKNKKVLFVSQNTEALNVVIRKYKDLNKEYHFEPANLSFLDFCLNLNSAEQRKRKYLKEQKSRIMDHPVPTTFSASVFEENGLYPLTYTCPDYPTDKPILGMDELLSYEIDSTNLDTDKKLIATNYIRLPIDSNLRKVFESLKNYPLTKEEFRSFNHPTDELKYISFKSSSSDTPTINEPIIKESIDDLYRFLKSISLEESSLCAQTEMSLEEYLNHLFVLSSSQEYLNLSALEKNSINFLLEKIISYNKSQKSIKPIDESEISAKNTSTLLSDHKKYLEKHIFNTSDLKSLQDSLILASDYLKKIISFDIDPDSSLNAIEESAFIKLHPILPQILNDYSFWDKWTSNQMSTAIEEIIAWSSKGPLSRAIHRPEWAADTKVAKDIADDSSTILPVIKILNETSFPIKYLKNQYSLKSTSIDDPLFLIHDKDSFISIANLSLKIKEILQDFSSFDKTPASLLNTLTQAISDIDSFIKLLSANKSKSFSSISDALTTINTTIDNHNYRKILSHTWQEISPYLTINSENNFRKSLPNLIDYLQKNKNLLSSAQKSISNISSLNLTPDKINQLQSLIHLTETSHLFSSDLFIIQKSSNLNHFSNRISRIYNFDYSNIIERFVLHNHFLNDLRFNLEKASSIIDECLSLDNITLADFCSRVTLLLSAQRYKNYSGLDRELTPKSYRELYDNYLFNSRRNHYIAGIKKLKLDYEDPSKRLIYGNNWLPAFNTIESFRKNTEMIISAYPVVIATPGEISKFLDAKKELFDYVIFDEASQLLPGQALPAIYRAKKAIIVGDPHQMPPVLSTLIGSKSSTNQDEMEDLGNSILDMAINMNLDSTYHLKNHYRSESNQLFEPSRKAIYEKEGIKSIFEAASDPMPLYIRDNLAEDEHTFDVILERISYYLSSNPKTDFCILFTTIEAKKAFMEYTEEHSEKCKDFHKLEEEEKIFLSTITNCQGLNVDHSILVLHHYDNPKRMWFFSEKAGAYKRLNVSITRQKKTLDVIMTDDRGKWISACESYDNPAINATTVKSAQLLRNLLTTAGQRIDANHLDNILDSSPSTISSPLIRELFQALQNHYADKLGKEIKIWHSIGDQVELSPDDINIGYQIDIGIYSVSQERFILGLEFDGSVYHNGFIRHFSDNQRQKILHTKNWDIYRVESNAWLQNPYSEFKSLTSIIDSKLNID